MKMNIKGLVFVGFAAAVFASAANAANDKIVTSKTYVDTKYVAAANGHITITPNTTTGKNEISADVGVTGVNTHDGDSLEVVNGIVTLPAEQTVGTGNITINDHDNQLVGSFGVNDSGDKTITLPEDQNTTYAAGDHVTITGNNNAIGVTVDGQIVDGNTGIVDGNTVYDYVTDKIDDLTEYAASTNVTFTPNATTGKTEISATDTTYAAGDHVTITGNNNAIGVTVDGQIVDGNTGIVDGNTVYDYLNSSAVQSDYSQSDSTKPDFIKNKPTIGDATITIQQEGQADQTFNVNATTGSTITIAAPWTAPAANYCTASTPCALVNDGTNITWERIQQ